MSLPSPVLVLTNQLTPGGAERYVLTLTAWLAAEGVRTHLAATPGDLVDDVDPHVVLHPVPLHDRRWSIPAAVFRIRRIVRREGIRAIVANSLVTSWIAKLAAPGLPLIAVAHGWPVDRYRLVARPLAVADRVVAVSEEVADRLVRAGLSRTRVVVVPNGIDLGRFGPLAPPTRAAVRATMGASPDEVVLVHVGRFVPQKAQHRLIELADALRDRPGWRLVIVGWGELEGALRAEADARGLSDRVRFLVRRSDVPDLLRASDLYLSTSDWEGMPLSTIEAMAASLPIVATEVEGMRALVDEANGRLVPPGDADALEATVRGLLDDPALRARLGKASRERAEQRFSHAASCAGLGRVLADVSRR